jgi:PhnB protein
MSQSIELYPRLVVKGADAALEFYAQAFEAEVTDRHADEHGRVVHAMVEFPGGKFAVKDADGTDPAPVLGEVPVIIALYVADADALAARMIEAGAEVIFPVSTHDYGDRGGRLRDPWGHLWMVAQRL